MGVFNLPMFVFFLLVAVIVAVPFLIWSDLSAWVILLVAPIVSYLAIFSLSIIIDLIERSGTTRDSSSLLEELKPGFSLPGKPKGLLCPSCGSKDIATILYGLPGMSKKLEKAIENQEVTLGGCVVHDEAPQWVCNGCNHKFGRLRTGGDNETTS
jgi:hypothetical protein